MAPHPNPSESVTALSPTLSSQMPQESQTGLPGLKRGIAIGVVGCIAVVLIAFLAFFAMWRRKRLSSKKSRSENDLGEALNAQVWPQEKYRVPSLPPVEADTRTIYEMDASQIPELPDYTKPLEKSSDTADEPYSLSRESTEVYEQSRQKGQQWSVTPTTENNPTPHSAKRQLPLLAISPSEGQPGDISPLLRSSWGASSSTPSTGSVSPLAEAHLPKRRFGEI